MRPALLTLVATLLAVPNAHAQEVVPPQPVAEVPPLPAAIVPPPVAPRPWALLLGADALLGVGSTPGPNLGIGAFVAVRHIAQPAVSVEVTWRGSHSLGDAHPGYIGVRSTFWSGQLALCAHLEFAFFCPMVGVAAIQNYNLAATTRIDVSRSPSLIFGARFGVQHRFGQVLMRGFLEVEAMPLNEPQLDLHFNKLYFDERWYSPLVGVVGVGFALLP